MVHHTDWGGWSRTGPLSLSNGAKPSSAFFACFLGTLALPASLLLCLQQTKLSYFMFLWSRELPVTANWLGTHYRKCQQPGLSRKGHQQRPQLRKGLAPKGDCLCPFLLSPPFPVWTLPVSPSSATPTLCQVTVSLGAGIYFIQEGETGQGCRPRKKREGREGPRIAPSTAKSLFCQRTEQGFQ